MLGEACPLGAGRVCGHPWAREESEGRAVLLWCPGSSLQPDVKARFPWTQMIRSSASPVSAGHFAGLGHRHDILCGCSGPFLRVSVTLSSSIKGIPHFLPPCALKSHLRFWVLQVILGVFWEKVRSVADYLWESSFQWRAVPTDGASPSSGWCSDQSRFYCCCLSVFVSSLELCLLLAGVYVLKWLN